jgi:hypothetical protein
VKASEVIGVALGTIEDYLARQLKLPAAADGSSNVMSDLLGLLMTSARQFSLEADLLRAADRTGGQFELRRILSELAEHELLFEHISGVLATDALYRAEAGANRLAALVQVLPGADPPPRSKRFLTQAATCYLLRLDEQCVVMCRGAIEVLAETLSPSDEGEALGDLINSLETRRRVSGPQAADMREINRQAREVLHDTPHRRAPDALDCLKRLARLLSQLHPAML